MMQTGKFYFIRYKEIDPIYRVMVHNEIWKALAVLVFEYPGFKAWYRKLFNWDYTLKTNRDILLCYHKENIAGIAILKNDVAEKKICTLRVGMKYRNCGIGKELIKKSIEILETENPMITVRKSKSPAFMPLFQYYGFKLEQDIRGYYWVFGSEMVYNGNLPCRDWRQHVNVGMFEPSIIINESRIWFYEKDFYWRGPWRWKNNDCTEVELLHGI